MFFKCDSKDECQKLFRKLALRVHPDMGGSNELMILLQEAFDDRIKYLEKPKKKSTEKKKSKDKPKKDKPKQADKIYENVYEKIYFDDDRLSVLDEILEYLKAHNNLKINFVHDVQRYLQENDFMTSGQYNALVKIYYQYEMHKK